MSQRRAFFWLNIVPSAVSGGIWGAAPLSPLVLVLIVAALAAAQIWTVRTQLIRGLYPWLSVPIISFAILAIGGCFALIGYAFVWTSLGGSFVAN